MDSKFGTRLGLLNPMRYRLATSPDTYGNSISPFNDITAGNNWYYHGVPGYDNGSGIASIIAANLANAIAALK